MGFLSQYGKFEKKLIIIVAIFISVDAILSITVATGVSLSWNNYFGCCQENSCYEESRHVHLTSWGVDNDGICTSSSQHLCYDEVDKTYSKYNTFDRCHILYPDTHVLQQVARLCSNELLTRLADTTYHTLFATSLTHCIFSVICAISFIAPLKFEWKRKELSPSRQRLFVILWFVRASMFAVNWIMALAAGLTLRSPITSLECDDCDGFPAEVYDAGCDLEYLIIMPSSTFVSPYAITSMVISGVASIVLMIRSAVRKVQESVAEMEAEVEKEKQEHRARRQARKKAKREKAKAEQEAKEQTLAAEGASKAEEVKAPMANPAVLDPPTTSEDAATTQKSDVTSEKDDGGAPKVVAKEDSTKQQDQDTHTVEAAETQV